ncbi:hypothetical protein HOG48_04425 [Candidatus Peregrinibacteria bacterium]|jgi:hypothetical protein|nr:hypothetical protein [Candidatus Peregrinibacteria bacterium]
MTKAFNSPRAGNLPFEIPMVSPEGSPLNPGKPFIVQGFRDTKGEGDARETQVALKFDDEDEARYVDVGFGFGLADKIGLTSADFEEVGIKDNLSSRRVRDTKSRGKSLEVFDVNMGAEPFSIRNILREGVVIETEIGHLPKIECPYSKFEAITLLRLSSVDVRKLAAEIERRDREMFEATLDKASAEYIPSDLLNKLEGLATFFERLEKITKTRRKIASAFGVEF